MIFNCSHPTSKKKKLEAKKKVGPYFTYFHYRGQTKAPRGQMTYPRPSESPNPVHCPRPSFSPPITDQLTQQASRTHGPATGRCSRPVCKATLCPSPESWQGCSEHPRRGGGLPPQSLLSQTAFCDGERRIRRKPQTEAAGSSRAS